MGFKLTLGIGLVGWGYSVRLQSVPSGTAIAAQTLSCGGTTPVSVIYSEKAVDALH